MLSCTIGGARIHLKTSPTMEGREAWEVGVGRKRLNRNTETETGLTETERFGHKFGLHFQLSDFSSVNSVLGLG